MPARKRLAAIDSCHRCAGHQGRDRTLSLMKEQFWWPGMLKTLLTVIRNCGRCKQFEAKGELPGMQPIICTEPMELVHIDYVGMEVTVAAKEKPVVKNVLVVVDHFTRCKNWKNTPLIIPPGVSPLGKFTSKTLGRVSAHNYFYEMRNSPISNSKHWGVFPHTISSIKCGTLPYQIYIVTFIFIFCDNKYDFQIFNLHNKYGFENCSSVHYAPVNFCACKIVHKLVIIMRP